MKIQTTVSARALTARINRKLAKDGEKLRKTRSERDIPTVGEYHIIDVRTNVVCYWDVGIKALGQELGVLKPYEHLIAD